MMSRRINGFTLVELLIALVLMGLVMMLLFGGLRLSTRSWDSNDRYQQQVAEQFQLQQLLRYLVSQARNQRVRGPGGEVSLAFMGTADELVFVAPGRASEPDDSLYWYRLFMSDQQEQSALVLQARPYEEAEWVDWEMLFSPGELTAEGEEVLIEEYALMSLPTAQLELSYWEQPDQFLVSQADWIDQLQLPRLVEFRVLTPDAEVSARSWPPLAIVLEEYSHALRQR